MNHVHSGLLAGLSALAAAGTAQASLLPVFNGTAGGPGANTTFNYNLAFSTSGGAAPVERLENGDFVTIYDIPGFVSATAPANFSVSTQLTGINAPGTAPNDDAALTNVTFRYTGPTLGADAVFLGASLVSSFGFVGSDNFTSQTHRFPDGSLIGHIGTVAVPAVPEPGALMFIGALPLALMRRR